MVTGNIRYCITVAGRKWLADNHDKTESLCLHTIRNYPLTYSQIYDELVNLVGISIAQMIDNGREIHSYVCDSFIYLEDHLEMHVIRGYIIRR